MDRAGQKTATGEIPIEQVETGMYLRDPGTGMWGRVAAVVERPDREAWLVYFSGVPGRLATSIDAGDTVTVKKILR